jgi:Cysteine-rich secretory protein family
LKSAFSYVALLSVVLLSSAFAAAQAQEVFDNDAEAHIFAELNRSRQEAGEPALKLDPKLTQAARSHSQLLVKHQAVSHQFSGEPPLTQRLRSVGLFFTEAAENVGMNSELGDVNSMFLRSPGHRANMLNAAYDAVGIGVVQRGRDIWVTEDFAKVTPSLSAEQAEDEAAATLESEWKVAHPVPLKRAVVEGLRPLACKIAVNGGKLSAGSVAYGDEAARQLVAFSTSNPSSLAPQVDSVVGATHVSAYAVGACTPQQSGSMGQFWILIAFF